MMRRAVWEGLAAGAAGAAVMTLGEKVEQRLTGRPGSHVPARVLERLTGMAERSGRASDVANWAMHYGEGALLGVLRSVMAHAGLRGPWSSAKFAVVRLTNDQILENATGAGAPPPSWPRLELAVDLLHKTVYAFATGVVADALAGRTGPGPGQRHAPDAPGAAGGRRAAAAGGGPRPALRGHAVRRGGGERMRIEDYALIGDTQSAALIGRNGSIDWLCLPRFDSPSCFARLLGDESNGFWRLAAAGRDRAARRAYIEDSLVLSTEWETPTGTARVVDFMPVRSGNPDLVRVVEGLSGIVEMTTEIRIRFDYGRIVPWARRVGGHLHAVGGPDSVWVHSPVPLRGGDYRHEATFTVTAGQRMPFVFTWHPSHQPQPRAIDPLAELGLTVRLWQDWAARCGYRGPWREAVVRSLITLKALTYSPTGGIVAAPTTSLPERLGGVRNWDYRYCWLRDAAMTLDALLRAGYVEEADAWRVWLLRAIAGRPEDHQIMYGVAGERRLPEMTLDWLPGYENSAPVRIGNGAAGQFQLDVYGQVVNALYRARKRGMPPDDYTWALLVKGAEFLEHNWDRPDEGLWEVRGPRRHFVHSKIMAWLAMDRMTQGAAELGRTGPFDRWCALRDRIHAEVCDKGYDPGRNTFTQSYGSRELDAALLQIPIVGFLPADDPRVIGTVEAVERELTSDGFVLRYPVAAVNPVDGLPGGEGAFLACSFWLAQARAMIGRHDEAVELFERLVALANDVGLLAEEYDRETGRQLGNFPQAFTHVHLIHTAQALSEEVGGGLSQVRRTRPR